MIGWAMANKIQEMFLDTSKLTEIERWKHIVTGVTTNQLIMYKDGVSDIDDHIKKMSELVPDCPVSVELLDSLTTKKELVKEAKRLTKLANNVVVKVPITEANLTEPYDPRQTSIKMLEVITELVKEGIRVNVTAMMTSMQMMTAVSALRSTQKTNFVSLFWARSQEDSVKYRTNRDFIGSHPLEFGSQKESAMGEESISNNCPSEVIRSTSRFIGNSENIKIIVGSIRNVSQVEEAFGAGTDIVTITPSILQAGLFSRRSMETIEEFDRAGREIAKTS